MNVLETIMGEPATLGDGNMLAGPVRGPGPQSTISPSNHMTSWLWTRLKHPRSLIFTNFLNS